jgi:hypothetical protein
MSIYRSHWRDDPKFDLTNTRAALPHLACPRFTHESLMRIARYPVERNFTPPRHEAPPVDDDVRGHLRPLLDAGAVWRAEAPTRAIGLQVNGPGGGQWTLHVDGASICSARQGLLEDGLPGFYLSATTFRALSSGEISIGEAINCGRLLIEAPPRQLREMTELMSQVLGARHQITEREKQIA